MAFTIKKGTLLPLQQRITFRYDSTRGETVITDYNGGDQSNLIAIANSYSALGVSYDMSLERGKGTLTANDATLNNPIDTWELIGNDERKDLFQNPRWANDLTDGQQAAIRFHLAADRSPDKAFPATAISYVDDDGQPVSDLSTLRGTRVQRAYVRYQMGNDEFENDAYGGGYVLRHTTNVPARWTNNISDFNVGCVYSTASLLSEVTSGFWAYPAPPRLAYKINHIPFPTFRENFRWGWKKSRSNEETTANNRVNIAQSYVLEQFSTDDYGVA